MMLHDDGLKALIVISKVTGLLSMGGSSFIIYEILSDEKKLQKSTYFRVMLGMSVIEFTDGLAYLLGSWCVPRESGSFLAAGNAATCSFQGFLVQTSIGSTLYNASLALYYLLTIRYDWSERLIAKRVEPWMHGIALSLAYGTAIAGAALGIYVSYGDLCYIGKIPFDCLETYRHGYTTCMQGDNSSLYLIFFFTIWQWSSVAFTAVSMILIWGHIRKHETRMSRYSFENTPARRDSRRFAKQGAFYVLVFYFSHFFATVLIYYLLSGNYNPSVVFFLRVMYGLTYPLEGFLNFLVYIRPRMIKKWEERKMREIMNSTASRTDTGYSEAPRFKATSRVTRVSRPVFIDRNIHGVDDTERQENEANSDESRLEESESDRSKESSNSQGRNNHDRNSQERNGRAANSESEYSQAGKELDKIVEEIDESMQSVGKGNDLHDNYA